MLTVGNLLPGVFADMQNILHLISAESFSKDEGFRSDLLYKYCLPSHVEIPIIIPDKPQYISHCLSQPPKQVFFLNTLLQLLIPIASTTLV